MLRWCCHAGIVWRNDDPWRVERARVLKNLCYCTSDVNCIHEKATAKECGKLVRELCKREEGDCAFNPEELITKAVTNVICSIAIGCRSLAWAWLIVVLYLL